MQYIIMFLITAGMASADIVTGLIKAYCIDGKPDSHKMRIGGLHKLSELVVMAVAIGLHIGLTELGNYYKADPMITNIAGNFTVIGVFGFIVCMELVSILENFALINPQAKWAQKYIEKLKPKEEEDHEKADTREKREE